MSTDFFCESLHNQSEPAPKDVVEEGFTGDRFPRFLATFHGRSSENCIPFACEGVQFFGVSNRYRVGLEIASDLVHLTGAICKG